MIGEKTFLRLRNWFVLLVPLLLTLLLLYTDPDNGMAKIAMPSTVVYLIKLCTGFFYALALAHLGRRVLFDYPSADARSTFDRARNTPEGSGLLAIAISIITAALLMIASNAAHADTIPYQALPYLPMLKTERQAQWPDHPTPSMLGGLIEHESACPRKSQCWNPAVRLKSAREEGAGFGQITRAYRKDGTERFDALAELRGRHPALREWSWANVYQRPDLQLRALVLMARDNYTFFARFVHDPQQALDFADAGYNGGNGGVQNERRACGLSPGCDPQKWTGNVELHCLKDRTALYGTRSACDINRNHVRDVRARSPKYTGLV